MKIQPGRHDGFTMVELVVVIVVVGIIAAVSVPRLIDRRAFESRDFYERAIALVRQAQKAAVARRAATTPVRLCVTATSLSAGTGTSCTVAFTALPDPVTGGNLVLAAPAGTTLAPAGAYTFDALGQPNSAFSINISSTVPNDPARQITVTAVTGYVQHTP